jgi:hypothetical protein
MLKNGTAARDPALRGYWNCSSAAGGLRVPKRRAPWLTV